MLSPTDPRRPDGPLREFLPSPPPAVPDEEEDDEKDDGDGCGCGCLFGFLLAFALIYLGVCHAPH